MLHDLLKLVDPEYEASRLSGMLGFHNISSNGEIHNKNGGASVMVKIGGIDVSAKTTQEIAELIDAKRRWLNSIAEHDVIFKIISIREEQAFTDNKQYSNATLDAISKAWMKQFDRSFSSAHIIIFTVNPDKILGRGMVNTEVLHEAVSKTLDMLDVFKPSKLTPNN